MTEIAWYVSDAETAEVRGPLDGDALIDEVLAGRVAPADLLWCDGMTEWQRAEVFAWLVTS